MPKIIASFLGLADPRLYTGHSFRRTSATLLVDSGADLTTLKRHGGQTSSTVADGYIDNSMRNKCKIANPIMERIVIPQTATSHQLQHLVDDNIPSTSRNRKEEHGEHLHKKMKIGQKEKVEDKILSPGRQPNIIIQNCNLYFHNNDKN
ncbi:uncharacterized protein LOC117167365 [Belonocnema kinseyi]|uniref:uncharacterized protein LOC117167365 n=1 Tax=Belonocnema kinseyi TaxID=2817044 RepID=UPI00143D4016|nr:uncharacterized protein LOC117167365 [Belonocnema kinseyi]XP_033208132.1 uncharacterized protein LOC117167365 [Belonocnema kinseyi]